LSLQRTQQRDSFYVGNEDALIAAIVQLGSSGVGVAGHALGSF
jgi:hypothetical protein